MADTTQLLEPEELEQPEQQVPISDPNINILGADPVGPQITPKMPVTEASVQKMLAYVMTGILALGKKLNVGVYADAHVLKFIENYYNEE